MKMNHTDSTTIQETDETKGSTITKDTSFENDGKFFKDIPRYVGGMISGTYSSGGNNQVIYVRDTTNEAFEDYCVLLQTEGFTLYCDNSFGDNISATYTNRDVMVHLYYLHHIQEVRIITAPMLSTVLPPKEIEPYSKVTDSKITLMALDISSHEDNGLGIVVTLEDGSYIIVDGGYEEDAAALYQYLADNNKRPDGKVVIAAWLLTHAHGDHYYNFRRFVSTYSSQVTVEYILANDTELYADFTNTISSALRSFNGSRLIKPHTGQKLSIRNARLDVLFTHEDLYPHKADEEPLNNTGTVLRMTIDGQTFLIAGDVETTVNDILCRIYKESLKSDILQVPHHGHPAGTIEFYNYVNPSVVLYSVSRHGFKRVKVLSPNVHLLNNLNVREIVIADKSYKTTLELPYVPDSGSSL